ncbi:CPBP family glutamic-type intramembrane protease [Fibrella forsythiae]|uniref:CPBP family intramembrane metalloprotease n=1 Tax=Fibrella forsythiae TaxID=2817061 RepID=A0ABS3JJ70_9BACT|nr:CPBP family glutamic-type intramembrane protease [Fibrella forsythiae]MBO0950047.1 CPBP family intramembrane metalloprotease [Fibrella forsythiae]
MTELLRDIRAYLRADFKLGLYLATALWVGLLITINYQFRVENGLIDWQPYSPWRPVWYFGMYTTAYYGAFWLWSMFHNRRDIWRNRWFWLHTLVALIAYSYYAGFIAYSDWAQARFPDFGLYVYVYKILANVHSLFTIVLPLGLYYLLIDKSANGFYGMQPKRKGLLVYATLLALMVPIILYASFQPDFLQSYPTYRDTSAHTLLNVPEWVTALGYELAYGWDFVPTELLFRGFLVIGLSRILQQNVPTSGISWSNLSKPGPVLPMIVWYATIHFGRPVGETVSSLFGGYILGVLALSTRSIWGGLFIHIGIAWLMEAAAFWQKM